MDSTSMPQPGTGHNTQTLGSLAYASHSMSIVQTVYFNKIMFMDVSGF